MRISSRAAVRVATTLGLSASTILGATTIGGSSATAGTGETCPANSVAEQFYWQRQDGSGARWPGGGLDPATSAQNTGYSQTYPIGTSGVALTATITDPDNINEDQDSPFVPNSSVAPNPPDITNWDTPLYTKTGGAYGLDYLTVVEATANSDQTLTFDFTFTKPVLIPEFDIGDIDYTGQNTPPNDALHDSFQDEVTVFAKRGTSDVSFTFEQGSPGTNQPTITGPNTVAGGPFDVNTDGNLQPTDARGTVYLRANAPITSFGFDYSNGPDDAANDPQAPSGASEIPNVPPGSTGVSNNHAIRVSSFTVCIGTLTIGDTIFVDIDGDGVEDLGEPGIADVTVELTDLAGNVIGTTTTGPDGSYEFTQLPPNLDYVVDPDETTLPNGTTWTPTADVYPGDSTNDGSTTITLDTTSSNVTSADFGYQPESIVIAGSVWSDPEDDATLGARDTAISGVTIELLDAGSSVVATTSTDGTGAYSFTNLLPGTYTIRETQPTTYTDGQQVAGSNGATDAGNDLIAVTVTYGDSSTGNDFFEVPGASIAGTVFVDPDDDGVQGGAAGIDGVTLTLTGIDDGGNSVLLTTTTNSNGDYAFTELRPGNYSVTETQPVAYLDGQDLPGTAGGDANVDDLISAILLDPNEAATDYDFAELPKPSLAGTVVDENGAPIEGVTITIDDGAGFSTTTTTGVDGSYRFDDLEPGTYTVTESQPAGYGDVSTTAGSEGGDDTTENVISGIVLAATDVATGYDFVEGFSTIAGTVYVDQNNNGVRDVGEPGIPNASVTLNGTDPDGAITPVTIQTDNNGDYLFGDLLAGTYSVGEVTPTGYLDGTDADGDTGGSADNPGDLISNITLDAGETAAAHDFGEITPASISGTVVDEYGDPIENVSLTLTGTDDRGAITPVVVTTNLDGEYVFPALRPGTYTVTESQPAGFGEGGESTDDAGATTATNVISNLTIDQGDSNENNDFVETYSSIAGHVFVDVDDDGVYTLGVDVPLAGETVTLVGTDPNGAVGPIAAVTNAAGEWIVDDLLAGTYTVTETQPAGYSDGRDSVGTAGGTLGNDVVSDVSLPAGTHATVYDFGEVPAAGIAGNVSDENGLAIPGVTMTLTGVDSFDTPITPIVVVTDTNGNYSFTNLAPGTYTVTETQPSGYGDVSTTAGSEGGDDTTENTISGIVLGATTVAVDYDFVEGFSSIAGTVYEDLNDNGVQDAGEPGIGGVDVTLTGTDPNGAITPVTVQTDTNGDYLFDDLLAGEYTVTEPTQPAGLLDGTDVAGSVGGTAADPGDEIASIPLPVDTDAVGYDFGEIRPATISGNVSDSNGVPLLGVELTLTGTDDLGNPITPVTVSTDGDGNYDFSGLRPGNYTVTETQPPGYGDGFETSPSGDTTGVNVIASITVAAGSTHPDNDFVETFSSIAGTVYFDANDNGVHDAGEPPLAGVTVRLTGTDPNGPIDERVAVTDVDGNYLFGDLLAGTYSITEQTPADFNDGTDTAGSVGGTATNPGDAITGIPLPSGTDATDYDFGELGTTLSGTVFLDDDRDGALGDDEEVRLDGVVIILLDDTGAEVARTTTASNGTYLFAGLTVGDYTVVEVQPDGFGTTTANRLDVTIPKAGVTGVDFGEDLGAVGDVVFRDLDGDGIQDPGEPGVAGVTVRLLGDDGSVLAETVTGTDGAYSFDRLPPGDYVIEFVPESGDALTIHGQGDAATDSDPDWISGRTSTISIAVDPDSGLVDRRSDVDAGVVEAVIDLSITARIDRTTASVGENVTFDFEPVNNSNVPVTDGARVVLTIPSSVRIDEVVSPGWTATVDGNTVTLVLDATLLPGEPLPPISVITTVMDASGTTTATASIATMNGDAETTLANNADDVVFAIPTPEGLPRTGTDTTTLLPRIAVALLLIGLALMWTRRKDSVVEPEG